MRIAIGITNPDVWHNLDVFLDGKLLDREHFAVLEADDCGGRVRYIPLVRDDMGRQEYEIEENGGDYRRKHVIVHGKVEFRDRVHFYRGAENAL